MPTKYSSANELSRQKENLDGMNKIVADPYVYGSIRDKEGLKKRKAKLEERVAERTAPNPDGKEKDALRQRQTLLEAFIKLEAPEINKPAMPSKTEMWEVPAGAVGRHRLWDKTVKDYSLDQAGNVVPAKAGYGAVFEWKDNQRKLRGEEESYDPDIANVEQLRPQNRDKSSFADYKKMSFGSSPAFREAYDKSFPDHEPTPVEAKIQERNVKIHCTKTKKNGEPCKSPAIDGKDYCSFHKPKGEAIGERSLFFWRSCCLPHPCLPSR